ncbi:anti-sigma factor family protein [Granulicella cerasi]|uniref:Anti-sigma factor family protein n=1 Tax=Granulicella cerasi TaxID=741063 RepID=A0ABW1Z7G0_9BACT|nr:zf-HC2 domain-containing protein [Granulicella cerasi]
MKLNVIPGLGNRCDSVRADFSAYIDGRVSGRRMNTIAKHLDTCSGCAQEFRVMRSMQGLLAEMGRAEMPDDLQIRLRGALRAERERQTYLPVSARLLEQWKRTLAPMALRVAGGTAVAALLLGSLTWFFAGSLSVEANDDRQAHLQGPKYLYSSVPPDPIVTGNEAPVLVMAQVDESGRVYDYSIIAGPQDNGVRRQVEQNLLSSVFKPATVFGAPVRGRVMLTFTGVSVRG